ncbi:DnaD domain-containing protein [Aquibacillus sp. 3ASR75-11]|uniref:DnaD domain-containing protein n=1 Tax=Terrihalobacillus insolitus TaxID=2950438 RepID=A0A9X3WV26_9BACI|nr:DnaD domain-containing protein [Terrihalobacillus insolitus]MDC3413019.1 DnaD domain-containing protein [Terrihalobacillus insolitus]MDC3424761.1 DnaD domain-containing protein [Terrihalobacillus insolitus]
MGSSFDFQTFLNEQLVIPGSLFKNYKKLGLNETEVMVIMQLHRFQSEGNFLPTPGDIAQYLTITEQGCANILRKLIQRNFLNIVQLNHAQQVIDETYSLENLWQQLFETEKDSETKTNVDEQQTNVFILFEQEFGRPISPFEIEMVTIWLDEDQHSPSLIKAALREAVLMGKLNFKYIDRILREWKKKGIKTVEQARKQSKSFHQHQTKKDAQTEPKRDVTLYYNWLEEE